MRYIPFLLLLLSNCKTYNPKLSFIEQETPTAPNYATLASWSAHPEKRDSADALPLSDMNFHSNDSNAPIDVFYLYPTSLLGDKKKDAVWNASIENERINRYTDGRAVKFQASIFNGAGRVFAPRYRQAHYHSFFTKDIKSKEAALKVAYSDVKAAFEHYMEHWNEGRPIIIAAHSQGAFHAMQILKEFFDTQELKEKLVVAYLIGWPVEDGYFSKIPLCTSPDQTGCFCSWRTWNRKFGLKKANQPNVLVINPLNWQAEEGLIVPKSENKGAILLNFHNLIPHVTDALVYKGYLLAKRPKFKGSFLIRTKNYHAGDLNLYYMNVRENVEMRAESYLLQREN